MQRKPSAVEPAPPGDVVTVPIGYLKQEVKRPIPLSRLNVEPEDLGIAGAEIALKDNNTTGRFTKQQFTLDVERVPIGGDAVAALEKLVAERPPFHPRRRAGRRRCSRLSDAVKGKDVLLFNVARRGREPSPGGLPRQCAAHRAGPRHARRCARAISRVEEMAALARGEGRLPRGPRLISTAVQRAAKRFGGTIVEEREYKETPGARRSDSGEQQIQQQMPMFTQGAP